MLTHEIEARKRLHDHVMVESNLRRSPGHRGSRAVDREAVE